MTSALNFAPLILSLLPPPVAPEFHNCLVREVTTQRNASPRYYTLRNCSESSYCCDDGCCSVLWYTGPLAIFSVVVLICFITCCKACWDVYRENTSSFYNNGGWSNGGRNNNSDDVVRFQTGSNNVQIFTSPPPSYNVAVFLPQPSNRVPSYEEVMNQ